jgi:hypothetical protein
MEEIAGISYDIESERVPTIKADVITIRGLTPIPKTAYLPVSVDSEIHEVLSNAVFANLAAGVICTNPNPP